MRGYARMSFGGKRIALGACVPALGDWKTTSCAAVYFSLQAALS